MAPGGKLGATWSGGSATFGVWAPNADRVAVKLFDPERTVPLERDDAGCWWGSGECAPGSEYLFELTAREETFTRIDPRARAVTNSVGRSIVHDDAFEWTDDGFTSRPISEWVIYELHPGTYAGTLDDVADRLDRLVDLGVTAIELMPVAEFAGDISWGYNPALPFAVESSYGGPDALKRLVDRAHAAGLAVVLDVVYNHFGPSDLDLWRFDGWHDGEGGGIYFYNDWRADTAWGATRPDYGRDEVRQYMIDNALMWLGDYHLDGLRLDSTVNIRNAKGEPGPDGDLDDGWRFLRDLTDTVHGALAGRVLIAEDLQRDPRITQPTDADGLGFDAQWAAGFVHPVRAALESGDFDGEELFDALAAGVPFSRVVYTESHDEVANGRTRISAEVSLDDPDRWDAFRRSALGAVFVMTAPGIPMIFQGQEWADEDWFDDQRELDWSRRDARPGTVALWRDLIALRTGTDPVAGGLRGDQRRRCAAGEAPVLAYLRWGLGGDGSSALVVVNMTGARVGNVAVEVPVAGRWSCVFDSTSSRYHPTGSDAATAAADSVEVDGRQMIEVGLDSYGAAIYVPGQEHSG